MPERRRPRNRFIVVLLLMLGSALTSVALLAAWAQFQLLNTDRFSDTAIELLDDDAIRTSLSDFLIAEVGGSQLSAADRAQLEPQIERALDSAPARRAWRAAALDAHGQLVALVEDPRADEANLDLARLVRVTAREVGIPAAAVDQAPVGNYQVQIVTSRQLRGVRETADNLDRIANVLFIVTPLVLALAVALAANWRRMALALAAIAVAIGAAVVLIARSLIGDHVVNALVSDPSSNDAGHAAWSIGTSMLASLAVVLLVAAAIAVAAAVLARKPGPNPLGPRPRTR